MVWDTSGHQKSSTDYSSNTKLFKSVDNWDVLSILILIENVAKLDF